MAEYEKKGRVADYRSQLNIANSMTPAGCIKVARFSFGQFVYKVVKNYETWMFDVLVYEKIVDKDTGETIYFIDAFDKEFIKYWQEYWSKGKPGFNLNIFKGIDLEKISERL
jgi:hypothetical protein